MKTKSLAFVASAMLMLTVSCNKNEENPIQDNLKVVKNVTISIDNLKTRSVEAPVTAATKNEVKKAIIYLTDGGTDNNFVVVKKEVETSELSKLTSSANNNKGVKIMGAPNTATHVFVVLNSGTAAMPAVGAKVSAIKAVALNINDQNEKGAASNTTGSITMFGNKDLTLNATTGQYGPDATAADYYATVEVAPVVARAEVTKIAPKTGSLIKSFKVDGVFVKKFHSTTTLNGTASSTMVDYANKTQGTGQTLNAVFFETAGAGYTGENKNMRDYSGTAITFDDTHIAGYQVAAVSVPVLVVKLSDITMTDDSKYDTTGAKNYYVVVRGYKNGASEVSTFVANTVYKLDLSGANGIDVNNITEDVDAVNKAVWVGITMTPWNVINVTPVY